MESFIYEYNITIWICIASLLLITELFTGSFVMLSFGAAASCMVIVVFLLKVFGGDIHINMQLVLFMILGSIISFFIVKSFKPNNSKRVSKTTGDIDYLIENAPEGKVISLEEGNKSGVVKFSGPFMGDRKWSFQSDSQLEINDFVVITSVLGNTVVVSSKK